MYVIIFVTASNKRQAKQIAKKLLKARLVACVNIIPKIESLFRWQGKVDHASELLLVAKSKKEKFPRIVKLVKSMHSYAVPEIIAIPIVAGNKEYLRWIDESLR